MKNIEFVPKLITLLKEGYTISRFLKDLSAGVVVGIVALPLAIAFGIASGCTPQQGLITAIVAGFLISLLSGSRVQIGGPTGAFVILVASIVHKFGYEGLVLSTIMAGILLLIMGFMKMGKLIEFIPYPVTVGFTTGIAVIIALGQIPNLFGFQFEELPEHIWLKLWVFIKELPHLNPLAVALTLGTIVVIQLVRRVNSRIPGSIIAIILFTLITHFLNLSVETIGDRFGVISGALPHFVFPQISYAAIVPLFPSAIAIALLGGIESLLSAVVADGMTGYRHRSNMELVAQGVANIVTPLFGGIPATGAIARTATNIKNGGTSPISGIIHALTLLAIVLVASPLVSQIPFAVLAGILFGVAWNMAELHLFNKIITSTKSDAAVLLTTFLLTVFLDLVVAIQFGMILAVFLFMKRMIDVSSVQLIKESVEESDEDIFTDLVTKDFELFEINGPFFFGATSHFASTMRNQHQKKSTLILRMRNVPAMDVTALKALEDTISLCQKESIKVILSEVQIQPKKVLSTSTICTTNVLFSKTLEEAILSAK
jgi:SulP family sulfate permease